MAPSARVDKQSCLCSGNCIATAPEVFELDPDHLAQVRTDAPSLELERLKQVARDCPGLAIHVVDDSGSEVDF